MNVFEPLYEHLCKGHYCSKLVAQSVEAFAADDLDSLIKLCELISATESQADQIEISIRNKLSSSIFAAIKRDNILHIIKFQDNICDSAEDVARLLSVRKANVPEKCKSLLIELADKVESTVNFLRDCCANLVAIHSDGSKHNYNHKTILENFSVVPQKEEITDELIHDFTKTLFECEEESDPVSVMLLFHLAGMIGNIADAAENAADSYIAFIGN